jgi:prepilin-type processing-associated H-X9-DG protein
MLKMDPQAILSEARSVIGKIDDATLKQFNDALAQASQQTGMDVEKEVIAPLGDEWVIYRAPLSDAGGLSLAMVHKLRDGETMATTVAKIETLANAMGQGKFKIDKITSSKIDFSSVSFLQYSLAWTVRNGYLYVSSIDGLPGAVRQVENKLPSIAESDLYRKAMAALPQGVRPLSMAYSNPAKTYPELRRLGLGLLPLARAAGVDLPSGLLPDVDDVGQFMTPGANISWWDADGLHMAGHSAFPGAEIIGGNPSGGPAMVAGVGLGTAILLPSLGRARELSNRTVDAANLRGIAQSCAVFAADNADAMPDDLARLVANGQVSPRQLVSKRAGTPPLEMTPEMVQLSTADFPKFAAQIAEHCDFVYLGKGMKNTADASIIVAYEKPGPQSIDGMNLAFGDGHAEFVRWVALQQAFGPTNDYLTKKGLAPVDVQDMMRKAGVPPPRGMPIMQSPPALP